MLVSLSFITMMVISFTTFPVPLEALHQLHILLITDPTSDANGTTRAIEMAVEAVNNNSLLLPEYALNITQVNSKVVTWTLSAALVWHSVVMMFLGVVAWISS